MSDRMRITGMSSGLDTESIVQQLVAAKQVKVDNLKNDQKKLEWKQTAWQELNNKIYSLYSNTLSKLRLVGAYQKKTTTSSDTTKATVSATGNAVEGTQTLEITKLAKTGYLTGAQIGRMEQKWVPVEENIDPATTTLESLGIKENSKLRVQNTTDSGVFREITVDSGETVQSFMDKINDASDALGLGRILSFDTTNGVFNVTGPDATTKYKLTDMYLGNETSIIDTFGLSEVFKNDNSITGSAVGTSFQKLEWVKKEEIAGTEDTLIGDLGITSGMKIGVSLNTEDPSVWVQMRSNETIGEFVDRFNTEAAGTGVSLSFEDGQMTVNGPVNPDGTKVKYKLTQGWKTDEKGEVITPKEIDTTIIDAFGLGYVFENDNSTTGTHTGDSITAAVKNNIAKPLTNESTLWDIAGSSFDGHEITIKTGTGTNVKRTTIKIGYESDRMTIADLVNEFKNAGLNASFDETNQRFFISSKKSGSENDFTIEDDTEDGSVLAMLGLTGGDSSKIAAQDSEIVLNGATYTSSTNAFNINGLTINATGVTDGEITVTTATDYQGAYDTIKDFLSEYNELINEMDKLYNADSARKYSMLSSEEKESMTDEEVETWENTIKASLLRKDTQLSSVMNTMINSMMSVFVINGEKKGLYDFGIKTLGYFNAKDNEHHAYHIDGDEDDENTSGQEDKLMKALTEDPEGTVQFFADLCKNMYDSLNKIMGTSTDYSSMYKAYNDKQLKTEYDNYTTKIKEAEEKLSAYEDKWYDKFSKMETALAKLQSNQSVVSSMLGNS